MFGCRRDEQIDRSGRAVPTGLGKPLLDFIRSLVGPIIHRNPAEHRLQQAAFLGSVRMRLG